MEGEELNNMNIIQHVIHCRDKTGSRVKKSDEYNRMIALSTMRGFESSIEALFDQITVTVVYTWPVKAGFSATALSSSDNVGMPRHEPEGHCSCIARQ